LLEKEISLMNLQKAISDKMNDLLLIYFPPFTVSLTLYSMKIEYYF